MTRKEINQNFNKVFAVGYCDLQTLLCRCNRVGYNSGIYGWNYDVYALDNGNIAICTGYRSMPGKSIDYTLIKKYEDKARALLLTTTYTEYAKTNKKLEKLIKQFIDELNTL
jgi:hypothetical protein